MEIRELDPVEQWRAGRLDGWVRWVIATACAVTIALALYGSHELWHQDVRANPLDSFWFRNGLAIVLGSWIAASFLPGWQLSRLIRVATLLPLAHLIAMVAAWRMWELAAPYMPEARREFALASVAGVFVPIWAVCVIAGAVIARRRRDWLHVTTTVALANLLLLGLWLPLAVAALSDRFQWYDFSAHVDSPASTIAIVMVPPLVCAIAFAAAVARAPSWVARQRSYLAIGVGALLVIAIANRTDAPGDAYVLYSNFIPALFASGIVAIGALLALGVASGLGPRRARDRIEGVVAGDDVVAGYEITSWLRGPRAIARAFTVITPHGHVPVPGGAVLVAPVPAGTTQLRRGEALAVVRGGDRVFLDGFISPTGGAPFRDSSAPVPGPRGISFGPLDVGPHDLAQVALVTWRPCVAYLLILVAVGIPALAAICAG